MEGLSRDLRMGLRLLVKDRAFSLAALVTLGVCIGANTALFSVVHNVLLRPLPCPEPAQRRKEIGIRMALGSSGQGIFELVMREGLLLVGGGFLAGVVGAFLLRRSLESQLFGVQAGDPAVLGAVIVVLAAVALLACALPARRATRVDPVVALSE